MGTRCLVRVFDEETEICCIYRHFDGYPSSMGKALEKICAPLRLVNGMTDYNPDQANGMGCLAATLVARLKVRWEKTGDDEKLDAYVPYPEPGNVCLCPPGTKDCWEEYEYHVHAGKKIPVAGDDRRANPSQREILLSCYRLRQGGMLKFRTGRELIEIAFRVPAKDFMAACDSFLLREKQAACQANPDGLR
jgi:hypothetical protein